MFEQNKGIVKIKDGALQGKKCERNPSVWAFLGIPYADAPVGKNRWRAPQPVKAWEGVRDATKYTPDCPQITLPKGSFYQVEFYPNEKVMDEAQGLALNVWSPAVDGEKLPVLVWIHGGGFTEGSGGALQFIGETLAAKGIVVVTINYRLGALGYMAHPELTAEQGASGNYGVMDQIAALRWVHENIAAFGGDPEKVTIDGQSAGSMSVSAMMATEQTRGLFRGAIGQSGSALGRMMPSTQKAEEMGLMLQKELGCKNIEEMRACTPQQLMDATDRIGVRFVPIIDGVVIKEDYMARFSSGRMNHVHVIMGSTCDEDCLHETQDNDYENYLENAKHYGKYEEEYKRVFPAENNEQAGHVISVERTARTFAGMRLQADFQQKQGMNAYLYSFTQNLPNADGSLLGPFHSSELVYQFGTLYTGWRPWREEDYAASERMMNYWANFVKNGDPNGEGLPKWEKHVPGDDQCMLLCADSKMGRVPHEEQVEFMTKCILEGVI